MAPHQRGATWASTKTSTHKREQLVRRAVATLGTLPLPMAMKKGHGRGMRVS